MTRGLTTAVSNEFKGQRPALVVFVEVTFSASTLRLWSGVGSKSWNGQTWEGAGKLLAISPVSETTDVRAEGIQLSLSGIPSSLLNQVLTESRQGKTVTVWLGALDGSGNVIADPTQAFSGLFDVPEIVEGGDEITVSLTVESELVRLQVASERRWTHEDQQIDFAGDLGFAYVESLVDKAILWGRGGGAPATSSGGGGGVRRDPRNPVVQ